MKWRQPQPVSASANLSLRGFIQPALNHLTQEGDGDVLPIPFEFGRLSSESPSVSELLMTNLSEYKWSPPRSFTIVRYPLKVRRIVQFTPVDSVLLEALIFANGTKIEASRRPLSEKTVFSNRFHGANGPLLYTESLWNGFAQRGMELASNNEWALRLDIEEFYGSIPHSYLRTCLLAADLNPDHVTCLMNALTVSSREAPMGIPIGPHFSHLLAELCLADLDNTLIQERFSFTRFNDDIHIFAPTFAEVDRANLVVRHYLRGILGLDVNRAKQDFISGEAYLDDATTRHTPRSEEERSLSADREQRFPIYHSRPTNRDLTEGKRQFRTLDVAKVITPYLSSVSSDQGLAYVFRLLRSRGVPNGLGFVIDHLDRLFPVITEALSYMETVAHTQTQVTKKQLRELFAFYESPAVIGSPFLQMMTLRIIGRVADVSNLNKFVDGMSYLTPAGRRELLTIAYERQTLGKWWVDIEWNFRDWTDEWEQSALDLFKSERMSADQ